MNEIEVSPLFLREFKPLSKKYYTLKDSLKKFIDQLRINPLLGKSIGNNIYKARLSDPSKGSGKSGGLELFITTIWKQKLALSFY